MRSLRYALALTTIFLAGCTSSTEPDGTVNGTWNGADYGMSVSTHLEQEGTTVTGNGTLNSVYGSISFTVSGTFITPNLSLTLASPGQENIYFAGVLDGNKLNGTLNGQGLSNYAVILVR
jgi:hypothetical protein